MAEPALGKIIIGLLVWNGNVDLLVPQVVVRQAFAFVGVDLSTVHDRTDEDAHLVKDRLDVGHEDALIAQAARVRTTIYTVEPAPLGNVR